MKKLSVILLCLFSLQAVALSAAKQTVQLDRVAAIVNDDIITSSQLSQTLRTIKHQLHQNNTPLPEESKLQGQVLRRLIDETLLLQYADRVGVQLAENDLDNAIATMAKRNNMDEAGLRAAAQEQGLTFSDFKRQIEKKVLISKLEQQQIGERVRVPDDEVEDFIKTHPRQQENPNLEYHVRDIFIALPDSPSPERLKAASTAANAVAAKLEKGADFSKEAVAVSAGREALQGGDLGWRRLAQLPEVFADKVVTMKIGDIRGPIQAPNGFHIIKLVGLQGGEQKHIVTETRVRHILLKTDPMFTDESARSKLYDIRQELMNGADFAELAKQYSQDPQSAKQGGELGWVGPGVLVAKFEIAMNHLKLKEYSMPIHTEYGWHLIQVLERRQKDDTDAYQRAEVRNLIYQRKFEEQARVWLSQMRAAAYIKIMPGFQVDDSEG